MTEWTPKVGDAVRVTGIRSLPFQTVVCDRTAADVWPIAQGWVYTKDGWIHIRNLDRILEDERRDYPRVRQIERGRSARRQG